MTNLHPVYWNFDNLDVTFQGTIPPNMLDALEVARTAAQANRAPELLDWLGERMHVAESGARGGYAYRCDTGPVGATWFFSRNQSRSNWNIRASVKSNALASFGLGRVRAELYRFLDAIGAIVLTEAISRVDYCMDFVASDIASVTGEAFSLNPTAFVMHSHTNRAEHEVESRQSHGVSGRYTSVTCGKMPGRQVIIYDKTREVRERQKPEWWSHWDCALVARGLRPLNGNERIWRVEIRAGKRHLKDHWGIAKWAELDEKLGDLLITSTKNIRYTHPNVTDTERARWPLHPIWEAVQRTIQTDLAEMATGAPPNLVKEITRKKLLSVIEGQILGLLPTLAYAMGDTIVPDDLARAVEGMITAHMRNDKQRFLAGLNRSMRKYCLLYPNENQSGKIGETSVQ